MEEANKIPEKEKHLLLVAEDEVKMREVIAQKLVHSGFLVSLAEDGKAGLMRALEDKPDMIILDVLMPKMDGIEMLRQLRATSDWGKNVPVIFLTNVASTDATINDMIPEIKPLYYLLKVETNLDDLVSKIREQLGVAE